MNTSQFEQLQKMLSDLKIQTKSIMSLKEAASYLGITEKILRYWNLKRLVPFSKPGGKLIFYKKNDLDAFIEKNKVQSIDQINSKAAIHLAKLK